MVGKKSCDVVWNKGIDHQDLFEILMTFGIK
jgi:hypothetical protein